MTIRAVGYTRVSTPGQTGPDKISIEVQAEKIERYCSSGWQDEGWQLVNVYNESAATGATMDRPVLQRLLDDAPKGVYDAVIVSDLSRFGRNTLHLKQNLEILKRHKIIFVSLREHIFADEKINPIGDLLINILSSIYQFERETIKIRTSESIDARIRDNGLFLGQLPFGYYWSKESKSVEIDEEQRGLYDRIVSEYLAGKSTVQIARSIAADHILTKRKARWSTSKVSDILKDHRYYLGEVSFTWNGEQKTKKCEPLIEYSDWKRIEQRRRDASTRAGRPPKCHNDFLCHGNVVCALCGGKMSTKYHPKTKKKLYYCVKHAMPIARLQERGKERCDMEYVDAEEFDRIIWWSLTDILLDKPEKTVNSITNQEKWAEKISKLEDRIDNLKIELRKVERRKSRIDALLDSDDYNQEEYTAKKNAAQNEVKSLTLELKSAEEELANTQEIQQNELRLFQFSKSSAFRQVDEMLMNMSLKVRQRLVTGLLAQPIKVWPEDDPRALEQQNVIWQYNEKVLREVFGDLGSGKGEGGGGGGGVNSPKVEGFSGPDLFLSRA